MILPWRCMREEIAIVAVKVSNMSNKDGILQF
jgi:hypothetical protein